MIADLHTRLRAAIEEKLGLAKAATPGAQAAADIRAQAKKLATTAEAEANVGPGSFDSHPFFIGAEFCARIAEGGEPRG